MSFTLCTQNGVPISSLDDWFRLAPPKGGIVQWVDYRSAKELARAWIGAGEPTLPAELAAVVETRMETRGTRPAWAAPEFVTRLDNFRGEGRNHDLVMVAVPRGLFGRRLLVAVEAKADESFGTETVAQALATPPPSNKPARCQMLCQALFGRTDGAVPALRYQLLTAAAGALIEARNQRASPAILVVHEFLSAGLNPALLAENARQLNTFVGALGAPAGIAGGGLLGPFRVPGGPFVPGNIRLFVGKVQRWLVPAA